MLTNEANERETFQPWHSAVEFKRYLHRFMLEFSRIETLAGVKRTLYNQYDSLVLPLQNWLEAQGVCWVTDCKVADLNHQATDRQFRCETNTVRRAEDIIKTRLLHRQWI